MSVMRCFSKRGMDVSAGTWEESDTKLQKLYYLNGLHF